jgi:hypothetical protein
VVASGAYTEIMERKGVQGVVVNMNGLGGELVEDGEVE